MLQKRRSRVLRCGDSANIRQTSDKLEAHGSLFWLNRRVTHKWFDDHVCTKRFHVCTKFGWCEMKHFCVSVELLWVSWETFYTTEAMALLCGVFWVRVPWPWSKYCNPSQKLEDAWFLCRLKEHLIFISSFRCHNSQINKVVTKLPQRTLGMVHNCHSKNATYVCFHHIKMRTQKLIPKTWRSIYNMKGLLRSYSSVCAVGILEKHSIHYVNARSVQAKTTSSIHSRLLSHSPANSLPFFRSNANILNHNSRSAIQSSEYFCIIYVLCKWGWIVSDTFFSLAHSHSAHRPPSRPRFRPSLGLFRSFPDTRVDVRIHSQGFFGRLAYWVWYVVAYMNFYWDVNRGKEN